MVVLVDLLLAFLVFVGVNWAWAMVMVLAFLSILSQFFDSISGGTAITLDTTLVATSSIDILLLLARQRPGQCLGSAQAGGGLASDVLVARALSAVGDDLKAGANYGRTRAASTLHAQLTREGTRAHPAAGPALKTSTSLSRGRSEAGLRGSGLQRIKHPDDRGDRPHSPRQRPHRRAPRREPACNS